MKLSTLLVALLPLARAAPGTTDAGYTPPDWEASSEPAGGRLITDPERLATLHEMHAEAIEMLNSHEAIPVDPSNISIIETHAHQKRIVHVLGLLGVRILSRLGAEALQSVIGELIDFFTTDGIIWTSTDNCRRK